MKHGVRLIALLILAGLSGLPTSACKSGKAPPIALRDAGAEVAIATAIGGLPTMF